MLDEIRLFRCVPAERHVAQVGRVRTGEDVSLSSAPRATQVGDVPYMVRLQQMPDRYGLKRIPAIFFRTEAGNEPVRDWLKGLSREDRKRIGADVFTVELGWPIGMPVCRPLGGGLYEVRTDLTSNRIARIIFSLDRSSRMVLLHEFIKKTQKTPDEDLRLAEKNRKKHERSLK